MIAHVVLFRPRADLSPSERREMIETLAAAASGIPCIRRFRVGRRVTHGLPGYEQAMREGYEYAAIAEFDDIVGLKAYLEHPLHSAVARCYAGTAETALAYDYEVVDASDTAAMNRL